METFLWTPNDRAATYQLTQEALVRGFDRGWTGAHILESLESAAGVSLPQNVAYTLREWTTLYEALTVRDGEPLEDLGMNVEALYDMTRRPPPPRE